MYSDWRERRQRRQDIADLVVELGSYTAAAAQLGISRQRVHALVGAGLVDGRARRNTTCIDCGEQIAATAYKTPGRCPRCRRFHAAHGVPWSDEAQQQFPRYVRQGLCRRGHEMNEENAYITSDGRRQCRACNTLRAKRRRADPNV